MKRSLSRIKTPGGVENDTIVNAGQRAILHAMLRFQEKDPAAIPRELSHRVVYAFVKDDKSEVEAVTRGGAIHIDSGGKPLVLGSPLGEGIWLAGNGVEDGFSGHRRGAIRPQGGIPFQKARYAFDFIQFNEKGEAFFGDKSVNANWLSYGSQVFAVADARVEAVRDNIPDSRPYDPDTLNGLTGETLGGNAIVLAMGNGLYAFYGHLKPGSISVKKGDVVRKGQVIGLVGNSGNSDAPHLHFQVNRSIPVRGEAVPYAFEKFVSISEAGKSVFARSLVLGPLAESMEISVPSGMENQGFVKNGQKINLGKLASVKVKVNILEKAMANKKPDLDRQGKTILSEMPKSGSLIRFVEK